MKNIKQRILSFYYAHERLTRISCFVVLSLCYMIFYMHNGQFIVKQDVDTSFQFSRISGLGNIFHSPTNFTYYNHLGILTSVFYPWLTAYPMYLFTALTHNVVTGYYLYGVLLAFVTLDIAYWSMHYISKRRSMSVLFAVFYTFSLCRTINLYCRYALGEVIGMTFLPLVLLGIYQVFYDKKPRWGMLALGMTLLVYTHMISLVIGFVMIIAFLLLRGIQRKWTVKRLVTLVKAGAMSALLSCGMLLPMLEQFVRTKIATPASYTLATTAAHVSDFWSASLNNVTGISDVLGIVILVLGIICVVRFTHIKGFYRDCLWIAAFFMYISTEIFPWDMFQRIGAVVQFPWRFLVVATLLLAFVGAKACIDWLPQRNVWKGVLLCALCVVIVHLGCVTQARYDAGYDYALDKAYFERQMKTNDVVCFNGSGDYKPDKGNIDEEDILHHRVKIGDTWRQTPYTYTNDTITYKLSYQGDEKTAILPVYAFPGEVITHNGKQIKQKVSYNGTTEVPLTKGHNSYTIRYTYTPLARAAQSVSLITAVVWGGIAVYGYYRKKHKS